MSRSELTVHTYTLTLAHRLSLFICLCVCVCSIAHTYILGIPLNERWYSKRKLESSSRTRTQRTSAKGSCVSISVYVFVFVLLSFHSHISAVHSVKYIDTYPYIRKEHTTQVLSSIDVQVVIRKYKYNVEMLVCMIRPLRRSR